MERIIAYQFIFLKTDEVWRITATSYEQTAAGVSLIEDETADDHVPVRARRQKQVHVEPRSSATTPDSDRIAGLCPQGKRRTPRGAGRKCRVARSLIEIFRIYPCRHFDRMP